MDEETKQLIVGMAKDMGTLKSDVGDLKSDVGDLKFDLSCFREETDVNFSVVNGEFERLENHVDGFARQSIRFDTEDSAMRSRQDRMEERLDRLERKIR